MGQQVCSVAEALVIARDKGLDLVEISPNAVPPVVKIIDYKKFLYEQKRKQITKRRRKNTKFFR